MLQTTPLERLESLRLLYLSKYIEIDTNHKMIPKSVANINKQLKFEERIENSEKQIKLLLRFAEGKKPKY